MPDKNHYDVLGVDANASQSEIKKAYQKLAKQWHPDVNKAEGAEARFKEIAAAYEILGSEEKRRDYDASRRRSASGFGGASRGRSSGSQEPGFGSGGSNFDWINDLQHEDIFDMFFNERMGGMGGIPGGFGSATADAGPRRPTQSTLEVTLEQAYAGETVRIELGGKKIGLRLPERSRNGQTVRMKGSGNNGLALGEELLIVLKIAEHAVYSLEEENLVAALRISPWQAALGGQARILLPDGAAVNMNIPRGIAARRRLRIPRRGLKKADGTYGDFFAEIEITIPDPSKEEEELYRRLEALSTFKPQLGKRKT